MVFSDVNLLAVRSHTLSFHFNWSIPGFLALVAGVLALVRPKNSTQIIAGYLVAIGLYEIFGIGN